MTESKIVETFKSFINKLIEEINKEVEDKIDPESFINYELSPVREFDIKVITPNNGRNYIPYIQQHIPCILLLAYLDADNIRTDEAIIRYNFMIDIIENILKKKGLYQDISIVPTNQGDIYTIEFVIHNDKLNDIINNMENYYI